MEQRDVLLIAAALAGPTVAARMAAGHAPSQADMEETLKMAVAAVKAIAADEPPRQTGMFI